MKHIWVTFSQKLFWVMAQHNLKTLIEEGPHPPGMRAPIFLGGGSHRKLKKKSNLLTRRKSSWIPFAGCPVQCKANAVKLQTLVMKTDGLEKNQKFAISHVKDCEPGTWFLTACGKKYIFPPKCGFVSKMYKSELLWERLSEVLKKKEETVITDHDSSFFGLLLFYLDFSDLASIHGPTIEDSSSTKRKS